MAQSNTGSYKVPPALGPETDYETWKQEIAVWRLVTDLDKKKQALAVTLSLTGQARAKALELKTDDLNADDGMSKLTAALDSLFKREQVDLSYEAYKKFDTFRKTDRMCMSDFILEFERLYNQCKIYKMTLPDAVLTFRLLDSANLNQKERQLALTAASDMEFKSMKSALRRIFTDNQNVSSDGATGISVKAETAYMTQHTQRTDVYKQKPHQGGPPSKFNRHVNKAEKPKGTNPLDRFGNRTRCAICQSTFHWVKDCQHKSEVESVKVTEDCSTSSTSEDCNLTLFTKENTSEIFLAESLGCAVIDTACTRTVCGRKWIDNYLERLDDKEKSTIIRKPSERSFKFGDGVQVKSSEYMKIPAKIGDTVCKIETEIVDVDIPLLLSKTSLKRAETVLDMANDRVTMFQKPVNLQFTSSGHYCIDINNSECNKPPVNQIQNSEILAIDECLNKDDQKKTLLKLHRQFGHASVQRLKRLLENAGTQNPNTYKIVEEVVNDCEVCTKYKRQAPKPAVGLPMATDFNQTVAVDLHELEKNVWYLHIIDIFTRFSAGAIMRSKRSSEFVEKFLQTWISIHGAPKRLFSDNGGEFSNSEVRDMCENFNIELKTTPGYSPWSNGTTERHNQTLTEIMLKVKADNDTNWETTLSWALMAKNSLSNNQGFSAYQLVFGRNPNLPSVLHDEPPALEGTTESNVVGKHVSSLYTARKAFTEAECSERIRRALRKQVRPETDNVEMHDKVYYKRPDSPEWKGPATVIGQDGVIVFVRHGGIVVRVHKCRLQKVGKQKVNLSDSTDNKICSREEPVEKLPSTDNLRHMYVEKQLNSEVEVSTNSEIETDISNLSQRTVNTPPVINNRNNFKGVPGQVITYKHSETGVPVSATILSRAGKASGKNKHWYNIEYMQGPEDVSGEKLSVDLSQVDDLQVQEIPDTVTCDLNESVMVAEETSWQCAKLAELQSWTDNNVYNEVDDVGQRCLSTRWVCTLKESSDGVTPKARLVVRGFEDVEKDQIQKDSPTCAKESLRTILAICAQKKWKPRSMDIKTAFLQGNGLNRDIFVSPPKEFRSQGKVWQLQKCAYGLGDASLHWYKRVKDVMIECGAVVSKVDPAVFYWSDQNGELVGVLASHVDDFIWSGTPEFEATVIPKVRATFKVGREDSFAFQYIGMDLTCVGEDIHLSQDRYAENLSPILLEKARAMQKESHLTVGEKQCLRSKIGQLLWIAHQSRPDVLCDVCMLAASIKDPKIQNILEANKIVKQLKSESSALKFRYLGGGQLSIVVFSDASFGNLPDGGTQGGHLVFLVGESGECSPLSWISRRIRRVVRSTLAGETLALADAIDTGVYLATLYAELTTSKADPTLLPLICVTDCKSLHDAVKSTKCVTEKRLRLEISAVKEMIDSNQIKELVWSPTDTQLADCLTKRGASSLNLLKTLEEGMLYY